MDRATGSVRRIPVTIYNREYLVRTDESVQHINHLAGILDAKMREISGGNPNILEVKIAVLAALTILDEKSRLENRYEELLSLLAEREKDDQNEKEKDESQTVLDTEAQE